MSAPASQYEGIIVLGMPRSGTTLLRRLLNAHPNICCPPETNLFGAASRFLEEHRFSGGVNVGVVNALGFSEFTEADILDRLREFVFGFLREIRERAGKSRWAEKTAFDAFHVDQIERLVGPHCRYVCLFRHPLDVVCSIKDLCDKMGVYLPELHEYVARYQAPLEAFAHAWSDVNARLQRFATDHPDWCHQMRYEGLVQDPVGQMAALFEFLDEATDTEAVVKQGMQQTSSLGLGDWRTYERAEVTQQSVHRWKDLPPDVVGRLAPIVNPVAGSLGYPPLEEVETADDEDARRRYQFGLLAAQMKAKPPSDENRP